MSSASNLVSTAAPLLFWVGLIALAWYVRRRGKPTTVILLPYQRGVLYRMGLPLRDVGPGKHRVWSGTELLVHGDTRPISVSYENLVVALQDSTAALYGFSASVQVQDMRKATYSARDYTHVPAVTLLRCARRHLNGNTAASIKLEREAISNRITQDAQKRLAVAGFALLSFRLTQLLVGTSPQQAPQTTPRLSSSKG